MNPTSEERLTDLVSSTIKALVEDEESVQVETIVETMHTNIKVTVAPKDFGKVIGRGGINVEALRVVLVAVGNKLKLPYCSLYIEDPDPSRARQNQGSSPRQRFSELNDERRRSRDRRDRY